MFRSPDDPLWTGHIGKRGKKPAIPADFNNRVPQKKPRQKAEPDLHVRARIAEAQRPKNSHNRMITGIGTPNSQSRIPRPMFASFEFLNRKENTGAEAEFLPSERKTF